MTRDNPGRRYIDDDLRWSRYERPLDAVDLTDFAGTRAVVLSNRLSEVCAESGAFDRRPAADEGHNRQRDDTAVMAFAIQTNATDTVDGVPAVERLSV